jgi:hypothetical protein
MTGEVRPFNAVAVSHVSNLYQRGGLYELNGRLMLTDYPDSPAKKYNLVS